MSDDFSTGISSVTSISLHITENNCIRLFKRAKFVAKLMFAANFSIIKFLISSNLTIQLNLKKYFQQVCYQLFLKNIFFYFIQKLILIQQYSTFYLRILRGFPEQIDTYNSAPSYSSPFLLFAGIRKRIRPFQSPENRIMFTQFRGERNRKSDLQPTPECTIRAFHFGCSTEEMERKKNRGAQRK